MTFDVIISGGGVAGAAAAAALSEFGYSVLVIEPGLDHRKRLAGELIHPPGTADLKALGFLAGLEQAGAVPVSGFAVFPGGSNATYLMPYSDGAELRTGLAVEHGVLAESLLNVVQRLPNVTVWTGGRVTSIDLSSSGFASVTVTRGESEHLLRTGLLIAADGRSSPLRRMSGIGHKQIHISNMVGYTIDGDNLPHPGFGHVFVGKTAPVLAYQISRTETRIMFDVPLTSDEADLDSLPRGLRGAVEAVVNTQAPLRAANYSVVPEAVYKGRMVCVGDAGGSCHPLTATGLSACTRDAILLRQALRETRREIPAALARYASLREGPQRTRLAGAEVLYDVFRGQTLEMRMMRDALFRYWQNSPRGRVITMALLSTEEHRLSVLIREYINVCRHTMPELIRKAHTRRHAVMAMSRGLLRFVK